MAENLVSRDEFARFIGVSVRSVSNYCAAGMPHQGGGKKGNPLRIDSGPAVAWYVKHEATKTTAGRYDTPEAGRVDYARELALEKSIDRQLKELALEEKRGNLVDRETVEQLVSGAFSLISQQVLPAGRRIIPQLKNHENDALALDEFDRAIFAALKAASQNISELKIYATTATDSDDNNPPE